MPGGIVRVPSEERRRFELEARSRSCLAGIEDDDFGSINWDPLLEEALRAKAGLSVFMDSASCGWDQAPATSPVAMLEKRKAGAQTRATMKKRSGRAGQKGQTRRRPQQRSLMNRRDEEECSPMAGETESEQTEEGG